MVSYGGENPTLKVNLLRHRLISNRSHLKLDKNKYENRYLKSAREYTRFGSN